MPERGLLQILAQKEKTHILGIPLKTYRQIFRALGATSIKKHLISFLSYWMLRSNMNQKFLFFEMKYIFFSKTSALESEETKTECYQSRLVFEKKCISFQFSRQKIFRTKNVRFGEKQFQYEKNFKTL